MLSVFRDIYKHRELLLILVNRNIKIRYKNSALGFFWTLLAPCIMIVIYATFLGLMRITLYLPSLVVGVLAWHFFITCLNDSLQAILGNANLVTKTAFPRIILVLSMVLANLVNFLLSMIPLVGYLLIAQVDFGSLYWYPLILLSQVALCFGLSLIISCLNVFFRDTEHLLGVITLAWFFLTPIIYTFSVIPAHFQPLVCLNPMAGIISAYRGAFISRNPMSDMMLFRSFALCWIVLVIGVLAFRKVQARFADEL